MARTPGSVKRPRLLDLFCCAGGAAMGYYQAGFDVVGVDIRPQPRYPFSFVQAASKARAIHKNSTRRRIHIDLIDEVREILLRARLPYVIENVVGANLRDPFMLCGTMFGLRVYRHRLFETSFFLWTPPHGPHEHGSTLSTKGYSAHANGAGMICVAGHNFRRVDGAAAMEIDWPARREEIAQAIPPAYTRFIGKQLIDYVGPALTPAVMSCPSPAINRTFHFGCIAAWGHE